MEKVIAVVVTYNRLNLLTECITALRNQTRKPDAILVINNGSTDNTEEWLKTQTDLLFITQKNTGSGGGFNTGIKWSFKNNFSWTWCMDDDGYPKEDALEKLLEPQTDLLCLRNCAVINKEDKKSFVWKTKDYASIDDVAEVMIKDVAHPFNGTLIHRNIIERVGVPEPSLFLWGDESEYLCRITKKNKIPFYTISNSIHYHPAALFSYKKDWDYKNSWKMYYYVRNRFRVHQSSFSNKLVAALHYCFFLFALAGVVMVYQKTDKMKKLSFIFWPAIDAFRDNLTATPPIILSRLNIKQSEIFKTAMVQYGKSIRYGLFAPFMLSKESRITS